MAIKAGRKKGGMKGSLLGVVALFAALIFMPTTIVLLLGMLPTMVAAIVDRSGKGTQAMTVGAMNLAGCAPFLIDLWARGHAIDLAVSLITDPRTIIVIYSAAGIGYLISWAMAGIVGTMMVKRSQSRLKEIKKRRDRLVERWGPEVTGEIPLDAYGFPIEDTKNENTPESKGKTQD